MNDGLIMVSEYRVLVMRDDSVDEPRQRVTAYNIDRNLSGRGVDFPTAVEDMQLTLKDAVEYYLSENLPVEIGELDDELVSIYEDSDLHKTEDGEVVLFRVKLHVKWDFYRRDGTNIDMSGFPPALERRFESRLEMVG